jgi:hypothetical protein
MAPRAVRREWNTHSGLASEWLVTSNLALLEDRPQDGNVFDGFRVHRPRIAVPYHEVR